MRGVPDGHRRRRQGRTDRPHRFAKDQLKAFVERVERLEEEKKAIADDIRDVYAEAKGNGFDVKALRVVVRLRKQDVNERKEQEAILETYLHALGMQTVSMADVGRPVTRFTAMVISSAPARTATGPVTVARGAAAAPPAAGASPSGDSA
jgi:uncharacterized protein (UPF0335 family)